MRRTILTSVSLMCLVSVLKAEARKLYSSHPLLFPLLSPSDKRLACIADDGLWDEAVHFTASRYLWDAQSPMEFYRAWNAKPMYLIEKFGFQQFWQYASPDDADEFTRIMLTMYVPPTPLTPPLFRHSGIVVYLRGRVLQINRSRCHGLLPARRRFLQPGVCACVVN